MRNSRTIFIRFFLLVCAGQWSVHLNGPATLRIAGCPLKWRTPRFPPTLDSTVGDRRRPDPRKSRAWRYWTVSCLRASTPRPSERKGNARESNDQEILREIFSPIRLLGNTPNKNCRVVDEWSRRTDLGRRTEVTKSMARVSFSYQGLPARAHWLVSTPSLGTALSKITSPGDARCETRLDGVGGLLYPRTSCPTLRINRGCRASSPCSRTGAKMQLWTCPRLQGSGLPDGA
jgi:hypothetical protein